MKIEVTSEVASHRVNQAYQCLRVTFEKEDKHFFRSECNWLPKDEEVLKIMKIMFCLSPTFRDEAVRYVNQQKEVFKNERLSVK